MHAHHRFRRGPAIAGRRPDVKTLGVTAWTIRRQRPTQVARRRTAARGDLLLAIDARPAVNADAVLEAPWSRARPGTTGQSASVRRKEATLDVDVAVPGGRGHRSHVDEQISGRRSLGGPDAICSTQQVGGAEPQPPRASPTSSAARAQRSAWPLHRAGAGVQCLLSAAIGPGRV